MTWTRRLGGVLGAWGLLGWVNLPAHADPWYVEKGVASYYGQEFQGKTTASGERFSPKEMTAAHRTLPLGTKAIVENLETGETAEVKITDRGPYADPKRRIIDLSKAAADSIGLVEQGVTRVRVAVTEPPAARQKDAGEKVFYEVQVGAFEQSEDAEQVLEQARSWYPKAYIVPREGPLGPYYRVRIGPFEAKERAQQVANALKRGGHRVFLDEVPESAVPEEAPRPADERR
jgi:rare lipoprotein A